MQSFPFMSAEQAEARLTYDEAREMAAYTMGVQALTWGFQFIKTGAALRHFAAPLPSGQARLDIDPLPHGYDVYGHAKKLLTDELKFVETPNSETLYAMSIIDLDEGPMVVTHPDLGDRYFRTSVWDVFGSTHTISQKKDGPKPDPYVILPWKWHGELPQGLKVIRERSRLVMTGIHVAVYGDEDLPNVVALWDGFGLVPLAHWGTSNEPARALEPDEVHPLVRPGTKTPEDLILFEMLGETLKDIYELPDNERGFAAQLTHIGITRRDGFDFESLDAPTARGLARAALDAQSLIGYAGERLAPVQRGGTWLVPFDLAALDDWRFRAAVGYEHVWGDLSSEVLFPRLHRDAEGRPLDGSKKYTLHFPKGEHPEARYWRISMYDPDGFFVANPIKRYGIGNMAETLKPNTDGSLTLRIQHESPGEDDEANWLPAPAGEFWLMMRMYQPTERMQRGEYILPPVVPVES